MINLLLYSGNFLAHFSTFFIAMLPFIEAKGAIPIGMSLGLSPINSFFCSYIGSLVPVPFLLMLIIPLLNYLSTNKKWSNWAKKINNYINKKTTKVQSLNEKIIVDKPIKLFALFMFVAIPLPGTGVWSGSLVAGALKVKPTHAFLIIALADFFSSSLIFLATFGFFV